MYSEKDKTLKKYIKLLFEITNLIVTSKNIGRIFSNIYSLLRNIGTVRIFWARLDFGSIFYQNQFLETN